MIVIEISALSSHVTNTE